MDELQKQKWLQAINNQQNLAFDVNPEMFRPPVIRDYDTAISPLTPLNTDALNRVIVPAVMNEYKTPDNYINNSNEFLEGQLDNPSQAPDALETTRKKKLLEMLNPQLVG